MCCVCVVYVCCVCVVCVCVCVRVCVCVCVCVQLHYVLSVCSTSELTFSLKHLIVIVIDHSYKQLRYQKLKNFLLE